MCLGWGSKQLEILEFYELVGPRYASLSAIESAISKLNIFA